MAEPLKRRCNLGILLGIKAQVFRSGAIVMINWQSVLSVISLQILLYFYYCSVQLGQYHLCFEGGNDRIL